MASTINRPIGQPQPPVPAGAATEDQEDLASRIEAEGSFDDLRSETEPTGQAEREQAAPPTASPDPVAELTRRFDEREAEWKQERTQLLGMVNRQQPAPIVTVQAPPAPVAKPVPRSRDEILKALQDNPLETVESIVSDRVGEAVRQVREELTGKVENVRAETQQQRVFISATERDRSQVATEFADIYSDPKLGGENGEFDSECAKELKAMNGEEWWKTYRPGDAMNAASRVYARWSRSGKLAGIQSSRNGSTNGSGIRELIRQPVTHSDRSMSSNGAPRGNSNAQPRTIAELGLTGAEQRAATKVMRDMGLSEQVYVANYLAAQKDNPNFGKG